jgi:uncharacterized protein (TIGR03083 family)
MDTRRLHDRLGEDYRLLRAAVDKADPAARVPSCPDWTAADLTLHVANVYQHKADCMREGAIPANWAGLPDGHPPTLLDDAYQALQRQFGAHTPDAYAPTWHDGDQTVGFWIRRMAQETMIHRVDAELTADLPVSPIPDDVATDGVDELLKLFLANGSIRWRQYLGDLLTAPDERPIRVTTTTGRSWLIRARPGELEATDCTPDAYADLIVSASPARLILWLWNRVPDPAVTLTGDPDLLDQFRAHRVALT